MPTEVPDYDPDRPLRSLGRNGWRGIDIVYGLLIAFFLTTVVLAAYVFFAEDEAFNPWGEHPVQQVVNGTRGADGIPEISLSRDGTMIATSLLCIEHSEPVPVVSELFWQFESPLGAQIPAGDGAPTFLPGCTWFVVDLDDCPPDAVDCFESWDNDFTPHPELVERIEEPHAQGINQELTFRGFNEPEGGGAVDSWQTETFRVVP